eukprot:3264461-Rhodomonas_salina.2
MNKAFAVRIPVLTQDLPLPAGVPDSTQQPITTEWGGGRPLHHQGSLVGQNQPGRPLGHQGSMGGQGPNMQHHQFQSPTMQGIPAAAPPPLGAGPGENGAAAADDEDKEAANKPDEVGSFAKMDEGWEHRQISAAGLTPMMNAAKAGDKEAVQVANHTKSPISTLAYPPRHN